MVMLTWASEDKVIKGCLAFAIWWLLAVFPAFPLLPIGRTAGSLVGAALMVLFGVISPDDAFKAVDLSILGLLFATMVISVYMERAHMFDYLGTALSWKTRGGTDVLCRVCLLAAVSSAIFTNDSTCVVLTGFVLKLCREKDLNPKPFLLALACSANIGSAATPIGNPQNLVIAVSGTLGFVQFVVGILPAVVVGLALNTAGLLLIYGRSLSLKKIVAIEDSSVQEKFNRTNEDDDGETLITSCSCSCASSTSRDENSSFVTEDEEKGCLLPAAQGSLQISDSFGMESAGGETDSSGLKSAWKFLKEHQRSVSKILVFLFIVAFWIGGGMLQVFEAGVGLPWTAIIAALVLTVVDFSDATETLDKVLYLDTTRIYHEVICVVIYSFVYVHGTAPRPTLRRF
jgi:Na+/H+ antiporter NhaD/arsenite permease-like protein